MKKYNENKHLEIADEVRIVQNTPNDTLNDIAESVLIIDPNFIVKNVNESFLKQYNLSREDIIGHYCFEFAKNINKPCLKTRDKCPLRDAFMKNKPGKVFHNQALLCDARKISDAVSCTEFTAFPIYSEKGNVNCMVELSYDAQTLHKPRRKKRSFIKTDRELTLRNQLAYIFLTTSTQEFYDKVLQVLLQAMKCNYGIFGYVDDTGALVFPAITRDIWDQYKISERLMPEVWHGYWGRAIKEKRSYCSNKSFLPPKRNMPIANGIAIPIVHSPSEETIGLIILGDKANNFDNSDRKILENVTRFIAPVLYSRLKRNMMGFGSDISFDKERLQKDIERYRSIFNTAAHLIASINKNGIITDCNNRIFEMLGYNRDEIVDFPIWNIIHPDYQLKAREIWKNNQDNGNLESEELKLIRKDGSILEVEINISSIRLENRNDSNSIWFIEDITERKSNTQKIIDDRNRAEVYLDILGHDINNFNQVISSYSELLLLKPDLSDQYRKYILTTLNQSRAISDLISNIRKLSKLYKDIIKFENIDLFNVLINASDYVQQRYPHRELRINQSIVGSEVIVRSTDLLLDVFINIISNVMKFDNKSEVVLDITHTLSEDHNFWRIEIKDQGPGIPDEMKTRIFNRFEKGDENIHGSGLGLAVAKEVVNRSGGMVWVEDRIENKTEAGSNFVLLLPIAG
jgi:PAS domain S-box-containing protein